MYVFIHIWAGAGGGMYYQRSIICFNQSTEENYGYYHNQEFPISDFSQVECIWENLCDHMSFNHNVLHMYCAKSQPNHI